MPDLFHILSRWRKQILLVTLACVLVVTLIVFLKPGQYLAVTTALPASPFATDKASVFNSSVQQLYTAMGSPDDLDRIVGTGQLDTIYLALVDSFDLTRHFRTQRDRLKAAHHLRRNSSVMKSEYGELRIKVWDEDRQLAPAMANALLGRLEQLHRQIQNKSNASVLQSLNEGRARVLLDIQQAPIRSTINLPVEAWQNDLKKYESLIGEYQLMVDSRPPVLLVVEYARPANRIDRPERALLIAGAAVIGFFFALLLALLLERRSQYAGRHPS